VPTDDKVTYLPPTYFLLAFRAIWRLTHLKNNLIKLRGDQCFLFFLGSRYPYLIGGGGGRNIRCRADQVGAPGHSLLTGQAYKAYPWVGAGDRVKASNVSVVCDNALAS
jgi:hypothetical protein